MNEEYIEQNQMFIEKWQRKFQVLDNWRIFFTIDEEKWSMIEYDTKQKRARIYACDIDDEEAYILNQVIKIGFIECDTIDKRLLFIEDLVTQIKK